MQNEFEDFVRQYKGPKLVFVVTGGGIAIHQIAQTLGSSRILEAIHVPYSYEESARFIADAWGGSPKGIELGYEYGQKAVSERGAELLCGAGSIVWPECRVIACTAATTTNRPRQGNNHAHVAVAEPASVSDKINHFHLSLTKMSEEDFKVVGLGYAAWKRRSEDLEITRFLLKIALGEQNEPCLRL